MFDNFPPVTETAVHRVMPRSWDRQRWLGRIPIPAHCHPLVAKLIAIMNERKLSFRDLEEDSGVTRRAMAHWRYDRSPLVESLEAALNVTGHRLAIVPIADMAAHVQSLTLPKYLLSEFQGVVVQTIFDNPGIRMAELIEIVYAGRERPTKPVGSLRVTIHKINRRLVETDLAITSKRRGYRLVSIAELP